MGLLRRLWDARKPPIPSVPPAPRRDGAAAFREMLARSRVSPAERREATAPNQVWRLPQYLPGVLPGGATRLAMDQAPAVQYVASPFGYQGMYQGMWSEGIGFMGYPYLAELTQRPEYRRPSEVIAEEMTRKWLKLKAVGNEDKQAKIDELEEDLKKFNVRDMFYQLALLDGFFGRGQLHINVGGDDDDALMQQPLTLRPETFGIGSLKGFRVIDPTWTAPNDYNAIDPMSPAFYRPQTWFVMGRIIHASRLLTLISRPMPDILKPVYNFGGLALSQMLKPYVDNWLRTRQSVSDLIQAFTVFVLETDMAAYLQGGNAPTLFERAELFANLKNNLGTMLIDKDKEGFQSVSAPLGGLDHLQAQAQEHMASVSGEPLVKMTGITPSGLNATSDGEIRVFYDTIHARQGRVFSPLIETVLEILQLNRYGEIDRDIVHEWVPLYQLDEAGQASVQKTNADTDAVLIETNVITPDEARTRLRSDPSSPYAGLEGEAPEPVTPEMGEMPGINADPAERIATQGAEGTASGANRGDAADAEFREADHPRDDAGKFGTKGGGSSSGGSKSWQSTLAAYTAAHGGNEPGYSLDDPALKQAAAEVMRNPDAVYKATRSIKAGQPGAELLSALARHDPSRDWRPEDDKRKYALMSDDDEYTPRELKRSVKELDRDYRHAQEAVAEAQEEVGRWRGALKKAGSGEVEIDGEPYTRDEIAKRVAEADESMVAAIEEANDTHARLEEHRKALAAMTAGKSWPDAEELKRRAESANRGDAVLSLDDFSEADHPRGQPGNAGQFAPIGGGGGGSAGGEAEHDDDDEGETGGKSAPIRARRGPMVEAVTGANGKRTLANGDPLPPHIEKLKLPPAWTNVTICTDPDADLLATGRDSKGRPQSVYSEAFSKTKAAEKFARIHELANKFHSIVEQNDAARADPKTRDVADCLNLVMKMGIRPGSDDDTGAKTQAYGATTLQGRHVVQTEDGGVRLQFVGKKGVNLDLPVHDPELAKNLVERAKAAGETGNLFGKTSDKTLLDHTHSMDGGGFKTKDFRTHLGTSTAYDLVKSMPKPKNEKEYKKAVMDVAKVVSSRLGNTPTIALQSYISPTVFAEWQGDWK